MFGLYRMKSQGWLTGVAAGLAHRFQWDARLVRLAIFIGALLPKIGFLVLVAYVVAAFFLPEKADLDNERYGTGPRKRKEAEKIYRK